MNAEVKGAQVTRVRAGRWCGLAVLAVSLLVVGLDTTVVVTALPTLSEKLGASTPAAASSRGSPGCSVTRLRPRW